MINTWAAKWGVSPAALGDLVQMLGAFPQVPSTGASEAAVQQRVRLKVSQQGGRVWRNNVGALMDQHDRMIRYGLCNETKALNQSIKSADLIGITPIVITDVHIGQTLGVFTSYEVKASGWKYKATKREIAQAAWAALVVSLGGIAKFITDEEEV
jgi:hypothetical protein